MGPEDKSITPEQMITSVIIIQTSTTILVILIRTRLSSSWLINTLLPLADERKLPTTKQIYPVLRTREDFRPERRAVRKSRKKRNIMTPL